MDIPGAKSANEYHTYKEFTDAIDEQVALTLKLTDWTKEKLHSMGEETIKTKLAELGHAIVDLA